MIYFLSVIALFVSVTAANAAPIVALVQIIAGSGLAGLSLWATAFPVVALGGKLLLSSLLNKLTQKKQKKTISGISKEATTSGGVTPQSFILGWYATAGHAVAPNMSHAANKRLQNYIIDLGDIPVASLTQVLINNDVTDFSGAIHDDYGVEAVGKYAGKAWLKFYDGTQTVADPMLVDKYGSHPEFPWSADMVGTGVPYVIMTFDYSRQLYGGSYPVMRFVVNGIKLYDLRKDSSVGGVGAQRWNDPTTWEFTLNPAVMVYNIVRNISLADGTVWGLSAGVDDLDVSEWAAAMNACDVQVELSDGDFEAQYRAGLEVNLDEEPLAVIEELLKGCSGEMAEVGGQWHIHIGTPPLPIYFMTDDDVIVSRESSLDPFPGLDSTFNAITATHPLPDNSWDVHDAQPRYNAEWEAEDGGRRLTAHLELRGVPYKDQVQRLMQEYIRDERRMRVHSFVLPPEALICRPLQTISWTSAEHQYDAKIFGISQQVVDTGSLCSQIAMRERDPSDYNWVPGNEIPDPSVVRPVLPPPDIQVAGFGVVATTIQDGTGTDRRPAIKISWAADQLTFQGVEWEIKTTADDGFATSGSTFNMPLGFHNVTEGILPGVEYSVRVSPISASPTGWSSWITVTTGDIRLSESDLTAAVVSRITNAEDTANDALQDSATLANDVLPRLTTNETSIASAQAIQTGLVADITRLDLEDGLLSARVDVEVLARTEGDEVIATSVENLEAMIGDGYITLNADPRFERNATFWSGSRGASSAVPATLSTPSTADGSSIGDDLLANGEANIFGTERFYIDDTSVELRLSARARRVAMVSEFADAKLYIGVDCFSDATGYLGTAWTAAQNIKSGLPLDGEYHDFVGTISGEGTVAATFRVGTDYVMFAVRMNNTSGIDGDKIRISQILLQNISLGQTLSAQVSQTAAVVANMDGTLTSSWQIQTIAGDANGSIGLISYVDGAGGPISAINLTADYLTLHGGMGVFVDGVLQSVGATYDPVTGVATGWNLDADPANPSWISGDLIADGLITQRDYTTAWASQAIGTTDVAIVRELHLDMAPYVYADLVNYPQEPKNPLCVVVSGSYQPDDNLAGNLTIKVEGWSVINSSWHSLPFTLRRTLLYKAGNLNEVVDFTMQLIDRTSGGSADGYNKFRVVASLGGGTYPSLACNMANISVRAEQLNK